RLSRRLSGCRLAARPDLPLAVADPGRRLRDLPVPEAGHLARAPLAWRRRRAGADGGVGGDPWRPALAGVGPRGSRGSVGCRLRPLLLALRPRDRPRAGSALLGDPLGRARRVPGSPGAAPADGVA